jgi:hypothetical protein
MTKEWPKVLAHGHNDSMGIAGLGSGGSWAEGRFLRGSTKGCGGGKLLGDGI